MKHEKLREKCERLYDDLDDDEKGYGQLIRLIESFALEIRNEALEEAANLMDEKFHKVSRAPRLHEESSRSEMYSPFAEVIRALKESK